MTVFRTANSMGVWLSAALIASCGLGVGPRAAAAQQPVPEKPAPRASPERPADPEQVARAVHEALAELDIGAVIDEALRGAAMALEAADVSRMVERALADAHIDEHVARAAQHADAARILEQVHRALAEADIDHEIGRALDEVRHELRHEDIDEVVRDALEDVDIDKIVRDALKDIDKIVRDATEHAREHVRSHRPPK